MRLLILTASALLAATSSAAPTAAPAVARAPNPLNVQRADNCPRTTSHYAGMGSMYRGQPLVPRKLAELPPAIGYMAVYRTVNGCEVPMTIVEYRTGRRP